MASKTIIPISSSTALKGKRLATLHSIKQSIAALSASWAEKKFFLLALLSILPQFSRAIATGGWLSWRASSAQPESIRDVLAEQVAMMLEDVTTTCLTRRASWSAAKADARAIPLPSHKVSAVICSPPYPNRHDYTRVFGVELMFAFLDWHRTRNLRYQSFHSHPEARPSSQGPADTRNHPLYTLRLNRWPSSRKKRKCPRCCEVILDLHLSLREVCRF